MFDVVITNPPYMRGLHLKFLEKAVDTSKQVVCIHPSEWILNKQRATTGKRKNYARIRNKLQNLGVDITFIKNPWEEADIFLPISITHVDRKTKTDLSLLTKWWDGKIEKKLLKKIYDKTPRWLDEAKMRKGLWYSSIVKIADDGYTDIVYLDGVRRKVKNMYSIANKFCLEPSQMPLKTRSGKERWHVGWNTKEEAKNFIDFSTATKFMRAYLAIVKIDQNVVWTSIPLLDFTQVWDDSKLYEYYNLDEEEIKYIENLMERINV